MHKHERMDRVSGIEYKVTETDMGSQQTKVNYERISLIEQPNDEVRQQCRM